MRRELDAERRKMATRDFDVRAADATMKRMDADLAKLNQRARPARPEPAAARAAVVRDLAPGDRVHVRDIPQVGEALSAIGEDGRVEVQFGSIRMKVSVDRIDRVEAALPQESVALPARQRPHVSMELDLRGQRAEEALSRFETYIDDAFQAGMPFVRIIHGKGTGALRAAIREALRGHPLVRNFESAPANEGGEGVTVAVLAG
jgi:DNA mismatch repair protein MutS2